jgi:hypothetical protein
MSVIATGMALAGKMFIKAAIDIAGATMIGGSAYGIYKLKTTPPGIVQVLKERGVYPADMRWSPVVEEKTPKKDVHVYKLTIPTGQSIENFKSCIPAIEDKFDCEVKMWAEGGLAIIECHSKPLPNYVYFNQSMIEALKEYECAVLVGESRGGLRILDLTHPTTPHILIGGLTGGGKSTLLNVMICGSACAYTPWDLQYYLIDLKDGVEFAPYHDLPHVQSTRSKSGDELRVIDNLDDCKDLLRSLVSSIADRNATFRAAGVRNIKEFRGRGGNMPHIIVIADEIGDFAAIQDTKTRNDFFAMWGTLARKGRSAGIHLILCTQIPDAESVPKQIKGNLPVKIGFRMTKRENSETIFDSDVACHIPPIPGRAIIKIGDYENVQVPDLKLHDIENQILPQLEGYFEIMKEMEEERAAEAEAQQAADALAGTPATA